MSSCLSGGGGAYKLNHDLIKPPISSWTSNYSSSSSSSSLFESTNSSRKNRTPRKRPHQAYNEAASLFSTAYPKLFPTKHLLKPCRFTKPLDTKIPFRIEPSDLLMPSKFMGYSDDFPIPILERPDFSVEPKNLNLIEKRSPGQMIFSENVCDEHGEDFDAESILGEEIKEGIDSIMGELSMETEEIEDLNRSNTCGYGYPVGIGFEFGYGMRNESRAMRNISERDEWWSFPSASTASSEETFRQTHGGLLLKLNYDGVLNAWSDRGSPFSGDSPASESSRDGVKVCNFVPCKRNKM